MARRSLPNLLLLVIALAFIFFTLLHLASTFHSRPSDEVLIPEAQVVVAKPKETPILKAINPPLPKPQRTKHKGTAAGSRPKEPLRGHGSYPTSPAKLTIIAIWNPTSAEPIYLPNFFASVAANPSIDFLFIKYDRHRLGTPCSKYAPDVKNVREVCLSFEEYWALHLEFLCERWGGCTKMQKFLVTRKLHERSSGDRVNSYFRPFRAAVFKKWIHPETPIWGWCDMDNILGSFERNFPWELAPSYDIVFPAPPIDYGEEMLLFMPGHLAFFKHASYVVDEFMQFPNVKDMKGFMDLPWVSSDTEECEYSHFAFTATNLTFLRFPGIVHSRYHISSISSGVYSIENEELWNSSSTISTISSTTRPSSTAQVDALRAGLLKSLNDYATNWTTERQPVTSDVGKEYVLDVQVGTFKWFLWFPQKYAVHIVADKEKMVEYPYKRYVSRKTPMGPIFDRTEPYEGRGLVAIPSSAYSLNGVSTKDSQPIRVFDMLYNHFQVEKYAKWWALPDHALTSDELLFVDRTQGVILWNSTGEVLFEANI
ncbi:hypothetical protein ONZ45_g500 [Pleurotus djamor]|nr:hypothetical protein ONZ45_g500 [Pleurotus djamor]